ncbi:unnamed protein product [Umbelopsis vinacea]
MPSWMLEGFSTWNGSQLCMTPVISRALMLDIKQTELTITNLENMQQLVSIRLSMQSTRCVVKGLFMAFHCQENLQRFQFQLYSVSACQEVFDTVKTLVPYQRLPDVCLPACDEKISQPSSQNVAQSPLIQTQQQETPQPQWQPQPKQPKPKKKQQSPAAQVKQRSFVEHPPMPDATIMSEILRDPSFPAMVMYLTLLCRLPPFTSTL